MSSNIRLKKRQKNEEADLAKEDLTAAGNTEDSVWRTNLRNNVNMVVATTTVYPFKYKTDQKGALFQCYFCTGAFNEAKDLRNHNRDYHSNVKEMPRPKSYKPIKMDFTSASCKLCAADIQSYEMLKSHLAEHGKVIDTSRGTTIHPYDLGSESNVCQICQKTFSRFVCLLRHMIVHSDRHRCKRCSKKFNSYSSLATHLRQKECIAVTPENKVDEDLTELTPQDIEQIKFTNFRNNLSTIVKSTTVYPFKYKRGSFQCYYCNTMSLNTDEIRSHNRVEHGDIKVFPFYRSYDPVKMDFLDASCKLCSAEIMDYPTLKSHLAEHGKVIDTTLSKCVVPYKLNKDNIVCQICNATYQSFLSLYKHMNVHFASHICDQCGKGFISHSQLRVHQKIHEAGVFPCNKCDQTFTIRSRLVTHVASRHNRNMSHTAYRCPMCKEECPSYKQRLIHLSKEHGQRMPEFICTECNKVFNVRGNLTYHIKTKHLVQEKKFACTTCEMKFSTKPALRNHMVKHTGEKKFQCDICKKSYARIKTLREHMRIHNNDRRFSCPVCRESFVQKCSMKSHMRVHHPNEYKQEFES